jgi:hypothetical protein
MRIARSRGTQQGPTGSGDVHIDAGAAPTPAVIVLEPRAKLARAAPIRSMVQFEAGPAANNSGLRAVLRRYALARRGNAPSRQRDRLWGRSRI